MDPRFEARRQEMLDSAVCPPDLAAEVLPQLDEFLQPFVHSLTEPEQHTHTREYVRGLVSSLASKTGEGIADLHDRGRQGLQKFLGQVPWDHKPLIATLATQVGRRIGEPDAVLVFDPSAFPKKGSKSVGVARQWCGTSTGEPADGSRGGSRRTEYPAYAVAIRTAYGQRVPAPPTG